MDKLLKLCTKYLDHVGNNKHRKKELVINIKNSLEDVSQTATSRINTLRQLLTKENQDLLKSHRSSTAFLCLETLFHLLTFTLYSHFKKGSSAFWKSHGRVFAENVETTIEQPINTP